MEPEIARRCKSCGAAIRARSAFCPQCGVALTEGSAQPAPASAPAATPETSERQVAESRLNTETVASAAKAETPVMIETPAPEDARGRETTTTAPDPPVENALRAGAIASSAGPADIAPEKQQRVTAATTAARGVVDDGVRNRADRLRRASNVVLDEAAADPSLRFVLVATALIIISVLLLLLARVL